MKEMPKELDKFPLSSRPNGDEGSANVEPTPANLDILATRGLVNVTRYSGNKDKVEKLAESTKGLSAITYGEGGLHLVVLDETPEPDQPD